jgi:hypothetical protein
MFQISRRAVVAAGAAAVLLVATAACSTGGGTSTSTSTASATASAAPAGSVTPQVTAAANAFLATLDDSAKDAVSFDWTDTEQKQRWSNFPAALYERAGLRWGDLTGTQQNAWLAIMQKSLSAEGYDRVMAEWDADEALATQTGQTDQYGKQYYYLALIGTPSDDSPWMWQWGGHHVTVNATVASGVVSVTPSFIGDQPASYTAANGNTVLWVPETRSTSCDLLIFMEQSAKPVSSSNGVDLGSGAVGQWL